MASRRVSLTSTFLLLAAGGTAACDNDKQESQGFYCADANGTVVDEDYCDDNDNNGGSGLGLVGAFFIYHSLTYGAGYPVGYRLPPGGSRFAYNDRAARSSWGLPATGKIGNGTIKTGVVGKGGNGFKSTSKSGS